MLDLGQTTPDVLKVRSNVLINENPKIVYIKNNETDIEM